MPKVKLTKAEKVKKWMKRNNIGGENPWFDKSTTYYNLTINQIVSVSRYLNSTE